MQISQSVEWPVETTDICTFNGSLSTENGNGSGTCNCSWRKVMSSNSWIEGGVGAGDGVIFSLKGFRSISKYCFGTIRSSFHFVGEGLSPGVELMVARQLSKKTMGYMTLKSEKTSSVNTSLVHQNENERFMASVQIGIPRSYLLLSYSRILVDDKGKIKCSVKLGVFGAVVDYGWEKKVSQHSVIGASMSVGVPSGVTLKLKMTRANQTFVFPILLSVEILPSAVFYGTMTPVLGYYMLKTFYIDPYNERQKKRESEKTKEANAQRMAEKRKEASIAVSLMQETYRRIKSEEEKKKGLVIQLAVYGSVENITNLNLDQLGSQLDILDATIALQCLVKDSRLTLPNRSKSNLPGFYDPCLGEEKMLRIDYVHRDIPHSITIADNETLRLP